MDGSFGIIFSENMKKALLIKRRDIPIWVLPGGGIEIGETPEQAVVREVFEETGYIVSIKKKTAVYNYPKKRKNRHTYECVIEGGHKTLSNESKAIEEFEINNLPEMIHPHTIIYIKDALKQEKQVIEKNM
jgi:8-oxo-dGTP pyrophosphatase MutT (NUDIX family)